MEGLSKLKISEENKKLLFLSHHKGGAGTKARLMKMLMEEQLGKSSVFLDVDNMSNLNELKNHVKKSKAILLLLSKDYLTRPWVLCELVEAVLNKIPMIAIDLKKDYNYEDAKHLLENLETQLEKRNPGASKVLLTEFPTLSLRDISFHLSTTIPYVLAKQFDTNADEYVMEGMLKSILQAVERSEWQSHKVTREQWDKLHR